MVFEEWKDIEGYEGKYQVSNLGNIRSLKNGKMMKPQLCHDKRYRIGLSKDGEYRFLPVHRLVGFAFVSGWAPDKNTINHKDENPANNHADNLEWCSYSYNMRYNNGMYRRWATRLKRGSRYPNPPKPVEAWKDGVFIARFNSLGQAALFCSRTATAVMYCCKGRTKLCAGYQWKYAEESAAPNEALLAAARG